MTSDNESNDSTKSEASVKNIASQNDVSINITSTIKNSTLSNNSEFSSTQNSDSTLNKDVSIINTVSPQNKMVSVNVYSTPLEIKTVPDDDGVQLPNAIVPYSNDILLVVSNITTEIGSGITEGFAEKMYHSNKNEDIINNSTINGVVTSEEEVQERSYNSEDNMKSNVYHLPKQSAEASEQDIPWTTYHSSQEPKVDSAENIQLTTYQSSRESAYKGEKDIGNKSYISSEQNSVIHEVDVIGNTYNSIHQSVLEQEDLVALKSSHSIEHSDMPSKNVSEVKDFPSRSQNPLTPEDLSLNKGFISAIESGIAPDDEVRSKDYKSPSPSTVAPEEDIPWTTYHSTKQSADTKEEDIGDKSYNFSKQSPVDLEDVGGGKVSNSEKHTTVVNEVDVHEDTYKSTSKDDLDPGDFVVVSRLNSVEYENLNPEKGVVSDKQSVIFPIDDIKSNGFYSRSQSPVAPEEELHLTIFSLPKTSKENPEYLSPRESLITFRPSAISLKEDSRTKSYNLSIQDNTEEKKYTESKKDSKVEVYNSSSPIALVTEEIQSVNDYISTQQRPFDPENNLFSNSLQSTKDNTPNFLNGAVLHGNVDSREKMSVLTRDDEILLLDPLMIQHADSPDHQLFMPNENPIFVHDNEIIFPKNSSILVKYDNIMSPDAPDLLVIKHSNEQFDNSFKETDKRISNQNDLNNENLDNDLKKLSNDSSPIVMAITQIAERSSRPLYNHNNGDHDSSCDHYRCWMVMLIIAALSFIIGHLLHDVLGSLVYTDSYSCIID